MFIKATELKELRAALPEGSRIVLDMFYQDPDPAALIDPHPLTSGITGTVVLVDDGGNIHVKWDNGRTLPLIWDKDKYHKI